MGRLWTRPNAQALLGALLGITMLTALFYQQNNQYLDSTNRLFVSAGAFPYMNLNVHLSLSFSLMIPILLAVLFALSYPIGYLLFPQAGASLWGHHEPIYGMQLIRYTLAYYGFGSLTVLVFIGVAALSSVYARHALSAIAVVLGFWLGSAMLAHLPWSFLSVTEMQVNELLRVLAGSSRSLIGFLGLLGGYLAQHGKGFRPSH